MKKEKGTFVSVHLMVPYFILLYHLGLGTTVFDLRAAERSSSSALSQQW